MFIEVHMIQSFSPSNLNRDDTNTPKDCVFGGVRRARISSQCIKRAIRYNPEFTRITQVPPSERTRFLTNGLVKSLIADGKNESEAQKAAQGFVDGLAGTDFPNMRKNGIHFSSVALYLSNEEINFIVGLLEQKWESVSAESNGTILAEPKDSEKKAKKKKTIFTELVSTYEKKFRRHTSAPDIALFGRMLAQEGKLDFNIDAACQVAHAISTHRVNMELDFFTAADTLAEVGESGAAMMGTTGFNSACFYRYARIDWELLVENLSGDKSLANRTVEAFLRAAAAAVPTGKQNSFAAQNPPSLMMTTVREDGQGWSLANAFENPVRPDFNGGLVSPSIKALDQYWEKMAAVYGVEGQKSFLLAVDGSHQLEALKQFGVANLEDWVTKTVQALPV